MPRCRFPVDPVSRLLALATLTCGALAGCGGDDGGDDALRDQAAHAQDAILDLALLRFERATCVRSRDLHCGMDIQVGALAQRFALASSVVIAMSPTVTRPFRFTGRLVVIIGFFATIALSLSTLVGTIGALAVGAAAAALVHLVIGSPGGRPRRADEARGEAGGSEEADHARRPRPHDPRRGREARPEGNRRG